MLCIIFARFLLSIPRRVVRFSVIFGIAAVFWLLGLFSVLRKRGRLPGSIGGFFLVLLLLLWLFAGGFVGGIIVIVRLTLTLSVTRRFL
ncbi:MAG: hypothetical protein HY286_18850 [Planctomycetes bacterium]|nr:hypothetical protein [Planctomycetota bacterium]